jgi:hypothetical protein
VGWVSVTWVVAGVLRCAGLVVAAGCVLTAVLGGTLVAAGVGTETGMVRRGAVRVEGWAAGSCETWVYG